MSGTGGSERTSTSKLGVGQVVTNLRVWIPAFMNQDHQQRLVKYGARETRHGCRWEVVLPRECWSCQAKSKLENIQIERTVRSFENPLSILVGGTVLAAITFALAYVTGSAWLLRIGLLVVAGEMAWMWFRSSPEQIEVSLCACPAHAYENTQLDVAVFDNELFLFVPGRGLAVRARSELDSNRRGGQRYTDSSSISDSGSVDAPLRGPSGTAKSSGTGKKKRVPGAAPDDSSVLPTLSHRESLPPIKLDD